MPDPTKVVLASICASRFYERSYAYREEVRTWLHDNHIDPLDVATAHDVLVLRGDAPHIEYSSWLCDCNGALMGPEPTLITKRALLRVPLPAHLDDEGCA